MKARILTLVAAALIAAAAISCTEQVPADETITIDLTQKGAEISPSMYGIFFEEINHAGDGGLLAELVENMSFEELEMPEGYHAEGDKLISPAKIHHERGAIAPGEYRWTTEPVPGWALEGDATMALSHEDPMFESAPTSLEVKTAGKATLSNDGYWGMNLVKDAGYKLRTIIKAKEGFGGSITAKLVAEDGTVLAETPVQAGENAWNDATAILTPNAGSPAGSLAFDIEGEGTVCFDYVSMLPEDTFADGRLPFRKDVAQILVDLKPAFVRWPGGCVVEGISLENRFEWKKTLGDPAARPGQYSTWGYRCSYELGWHEMLSFCEEIGAASMFVCNVGMGCQYRCGDLSTEEEIADYLQNCLDAIEYAIGPVDSEWGAKRAAAGHPEAFPLKYVEIGNENWGEEYQRRYNIFHKAIREKYPELILINNCGLGGIGLIEETDMIDPHWYVDPDFFYHSTHLFDDCERGKYTAYVGEYAANQNVGGGNMQGALSEAAFIGGMERNADFVKMCSYAPLFENSNDRVWPVNLIWINSTQVLGRTSYYVQKMAASNRPDYNLGISMTESGEIVDPESGDSRPAAFYTCGYDEKAAEVVLKVVNSASEALNLGIVLDGAAKAGRSGKAIVLAAESLEDENSFEEPTKISPVEKKVKGTGKEFSYTFEPYSYTVLRIPASK